MDYLTLKMIHIFGGILFVGNIVVTGLWKTMADFTRNSKVVAFGQRLVTVTDFAFTGTGAAAVLVTGLMMTLPFYGEAFWNIRWLALSMGLFIASGTIWSAVLIPIQMKQARLARQFSNEEEIPAEYWRLGRFWMVWGTLATILPLVTVYFMVFKPE